MLDSYATRGTTPVATFEARPEEEAHLLEGLLRLAIAVPPAAPAPAATFGDSLVPVRVDVLVAVVAVCGADVLLVGGPALQHGLLLRGPAVALPLGLRKGPEAQNYETSQHSAPDQTHDEFEFFGLLEPRTQTIQRIQRSLRGPSDPAF